MKAAAVRRYDTLQAELAADERREIEARGGVAPNRDGTPRTIVQSKRVPGTTCNLYRARCSCGFEGHEYECAEAAKARAEARAHRCAP